MKTRKVIGRVLVAPLWVPGFAIIATMIYLTDNNATWLDGFRKVCKDFTN